MAIITVSAKNGYDITKGGYEYNLAIIAAALGILLTGPGAYVPASDIRNDKGECRCKYKLH